MADENAAVVLNQDGPTPEDNAEVTSAVVEQTDAEGNPQANANEHDDDPQGGKRLGGWQRKIKKLEQELEVWREHALKTRTAQPETKTAPTQDADKPPVKPKISDFTGPNAWDDYENAKDKYFEDLADYKSTQAVAKFKAEHQQTQERQTVADGWAAKIAEAENDPDMPNFRKIAFSEDTPMTPLMTDTIVKSEHGTRIAYELGQHPEEAERICGLDPVEAIKAIGKLEAKIEARIATKTAAADDKKDEAVATSKAPRPPQPVRRQSATSTEPSDDDDYKTWLKKREAQLKAR